MESDRWTEKQAGKRDRGNRKRETDRLNLQPLGGHFVHSTHLVGQHCRGPQPQGSAAGQENHGGGWRGEGKSAEEGGHGGRELPRGRVGGEDEGHGVGWP